MQADRHAVKLIREGLALEQRVHNFQVSGNSRKFCDWVEAAYGAPCTFLPNLYHLENWVRSSKNANREEGGQGVMPAVQEMVSHMERIRLVEAGWHGWRELRALVSRMHLLLQPSYTESFNMVTADGVAEGVPSVVSSAIDCFPKYWQACSDTVLEIARTGRQLLRDPEAPADGYRALEAYTRAGLVAWRDYLTATSVANTRRAA
ncbi:MAG: hypothetical protein U0Q18_19200 [Bryobacteraceae bacterium]